MTDSSQVTTPALATSPAVAGLYDVLTTTDHKKIGRIWLSAGLLALVGTIVLGVLLGIERLDTDTVDVFGGTNAYFQMWVLFRIGLALLVAVPLFVGLATVVVPMQIGSTGIAFPRAALAAAWGFLVGAGILLAGTFAGGGWGSIDRATPSEREAVALTVVGLGLVVLSILLASLCIATTVVSMRVKGMTLGRTPLFAWSMLVACSVWLLTLPVLLANLLIAYVDLRSGPGTFGGALDGDLSMFAQIAWIVEQPQVYAFAIPALGILGSIVSVSAGVRHPRHTIAMGLIGVFGLLSIGAWSQPYFQTDITATVAYDEKFVYIAFGIAALLPILGFLAVTGETLFAGRANLEGLPPTHLLAGLGAGVLLLAGAAAGVARVVEPFHLGGRLTVAGVMNLVLFAAVTAAVAGLWFWATKIGGRALSPGLGRLVALSLVGGAVLLGGAQVISGFFETSLDPLVAPTEDIADALAVVSVIGIVVLGLGALGVLAAVAQALRSGETGAADPWGGHTLEWSTATPPPPGNFAEAPALVTSEAPLLDASSSEGEEASS